MSHLYAGPDQRACYETIVKWAKLEGYDPVFCIEDLDMAYLEKEAEAALDYLTENVPDYIYDLDVMPDGWVFFRVALDDSVLVMP